MAQSKNVRGRNFGHAVIVYMTVTGASLILASTCLYFTLFKNKLPRKMKPAIENNKKDKESKKINREDTNVESVSS